MMITILPEKWLVFASFSQQKLATVLLKLAHKVRLKRFLKQPRSQEEERVHLTFANTSSGKLTIKISTAKRKELGNILDIPLCPR